MGSSLGTPATCPLCDQKTGDPVTLKCNHRFCQRCIGDLWSTTPDGPYRCPQWRCPAVYRTLPFHPASVHLRPSSAGQAPGTTGTGTSCDNKESTLDSVLRRPSLGSRLLGKRKASSPAAEQPDTKRTSVEARREQSGDAKTPNASIPDTPVETVKETGHPKSLYSERGDAASSGDSSDIIAAPSIDLSLDIPDQQAARKSDEPVLLDDSDSSNEVDICDAIPIATPKKATPATANDAVPKTPVSPTKSNPFPGVSPFAKNKSPLHNVSKSPPIPNNSPAFASASPIRVGISSKSQSKNANFVPCNWCPRTGCQPAVKTCLVCGASMCKEHLRPHLDSPVFHNHTLVAPVEDLSSWRCQEHQEINRIYCRQCAVCVCTVCTVIGSHRDHVCVGIKEAERELRGNLKEEINQLQDIEKRVKDKVNELTEKKTNFKGVLGEARVGVQHQYAAIREALDQEEKLALQCVTMEESRVLGGLEQKLVHLQSSLQSTQQGLHILESLADTKEDKQIQAQAFIVEYNKTALLSTNLGSCMEQFEPLEEVDRAKMKCLQNWTEKRLDAVIITVPGKDRDLYRLLYGSVPLLDADTAHPKLQLFDNNRRVVYNDVQQGYTEHEARFSSFPQVLAAGALEGGRWYWEVNVSMAEGRWKVGLCEGQIERKGQKDHSRLGFNSFSWCLACDRGRLEALHNKVAEPVDADELETVGVFLDFEEGVVSFFNVSPGGSLTLMHSYKHRFTDPLYPAFSVSKTHLTICDLFQP